MEKDIEEESDSIKLDNDVHLQEAVRIAAEYSQLEKGKVLGLVEIPNIKNKKS